MPEEFRQCLETMDVSRARRIWKEVMPHLPQPQNDEQALVVMHHARTQAASIAFKQRAYSHSWLRERGYPSGLPDIHRPRAEREYPVVVSAVGISINAPAHRRSLAHEIQKGMEAVVLTMYADGDRDPTLVKARMEASRKETLKRLMG